MVSFLKYLSLISILLWCIPTQLCAQGLNFENYSTHNGLPSAQVYHMYQDPFGDIWFATDRGIAKYDGFTFESFEQKDGLTSNTVFKFYPQKDSTVWCSTVNNSLFYFHPGSQVFEAYKFNDTLQKYGRNYLMDDMYLDPLNNLYISFENIYGHFIIDKEGHVEYQSFQNRRSGELLSAVFNVDPKGEVFTYYKTSSMKNVPKYDISYIASSKTVNNGYKKCELVNNKLLFSVGSNLTISDYNGNCTEIDFEKDIIGLGGYDANHFWLGFKTGGLKIFNMQGIEIDHYLSNKLVSFVLVDSHNGIWVSTLSNGVFFAHSDKIRKFNFKHNSIFSLSTGLNQHLLVSTIEGNAYIFNEKKFQLVKISDSEAGNLIYFEKQDSSYFSHLNKINVFGEDLNPSGIVDFSENDLKPSLFCSPWSVFIWRDSTYYEHQTLQRISQVEWAEGGIFFGTYNALYFLDTLTYAIEKLHHPELQFRITDIKMSKSYHYIGTSGNGLIKYNEQTGNVQKITTREGLSSDLVNEVFPENDSTVWVATNTGLNYVASRNNNVYIRQIKIEDGLPDNDITDVYVQNNQVWIATRSGLCLLDKNTFEFSKPTLDVYLFWEDVYCNEMLLNQADQNQLSHKQNNLRMTFHTAYFGGNKNIKFRYKLVDRENGWDYTTQHEIILNNLLPGAYQLRLQSSVNGQNWDENQIELIFQIHVPFYNTNWFYGICILAGVLLIYLFFRLRVLIYNRDLVREFLRLIVGKLKPKTNSFLIQTQGKEIRINSGDVLYTKSIGNYLELYTIDKKHIIRCKISDFKDLMPDRLEYLRVHRSYIVRIDKITGKSLDKVIMGNIEIPIGKTYKDKLNSMEV